jgi:hypothetical protein
MVQQSDETLTRISASIPAWLKERLEREAAANRRSFSAQVAFVLEQHYQGQQSKK